ncbi:cysteine peptidase family C39 domain-containing protein [Clostridium botulinum]|uniref:cysteine peptidase family C39 domain-containing protein n=1 Tax=Clostridium botulinum TaxID=1491 RepID=UPI0009B405CE|nr:cysteine peptidase family C39 domain-containing protein [Clostridium botulinum]MBY6951551.1 hypothetical protein [Clostridium botulinum]MCR1139133.1 cysteine peptidase family C39 domain-containing protein [Clostridium botulinum]NEZ78333.1 hypothetical protein [Clostridium botulinum]NFA15957.1 hypothetical protein [Clostridium botulinum]NFA51589.1 hypothetical protein [Clostridium botulinum]
MFKSVKQHDEKDCSATCLSMICKKYGFKIPLRKVRTLIRIDDYGTNIYGFIKKY